MLAKLGGMDVHLIEEPKQFAEIAGPYLEANAFSTNVVGVHLTGVLDGSRPKGSGDLWTAVVDDSRVVRVGMHIQNWLQVAAVHLGQRDGSDPASRGKLWPGDDLERHFDLRIIAHK